MRKVEDFDQWLKTLAWDDKPELYSEAAEAHQIAATQVLEIDAIAVLGNGP